MAMAAIRAVLIPWFRLEEVLLERTSKRETKRWTWSCSYNKVRILTFLRFCPFKYPLYLKTIICGNIEFINKQFSHVAMLKMQLQLIKDFKKNDFHLKY